jgi:hypothetical protein
MALCESCDKKVFQKLLELNMDSAKIKVRKYKIR